MKESFTILILIFCFSFSMKAQINRDSPHKVRRIWVTSNSRPSQITGVLYETGDSSILISSSGKQKDYSALTEQNLGKNFNSANRFETTELNYKDIETIKLRKVNNAGRMALWGAGAGLVIGVIATANYKPDDSGFGRPGDLSSRGFGIFGASVYGAIAGTLIGSVKIKIPINGHPETYKQNKDRLRRLSYQ